MLSQMEMATELRVSQSVISRLQERYKETGRVTESCRSGHPLSTFHADDRYIVYKALRNRMMNVRGTQVSRQTIRNRFHQLPDHTTGHWCHCLAWAREHLRWMKDQWVSVLFFDERRFMLSRNDDRQLCWRCQ
uniref:Transposase Tc1-like domain-containing protein n=1 Tax=Hippocampus comes TaxID=109280 RepID=A0A3Q2YB55_HIPCM